MRLTERRTAAVLALAAFVASGLAIASCRIVSLGERAVLGGDQEEMPVSLAQARVRVAFNLTRGTFRITRVRNPIQLQDMVVLATVGERTWSTADRACRNRAVKRDVVQLVVRSAVENGPAWETQFEIRLHPDGSDPAVNQLLRESYGVTIVCRPVGEGATTPTARFALAHGLVEAPKDAMLAHLTTSTAGAQFRQVSADAASGSAVVAVYAPDDQTAVLLESGRLSFGPMERGALHARIPFRAALDAETSFFFVEGIPNLAASP
jgi:hypothetical protein